MLWYVLLMEVMMLVYIEVILVDLIRARDKATVRLLRPLQCQNHDQNINNLLVVCTCNNSDNLMLIK